MSGYTCCDDPEPPEHLRDGTWYCRNCDEELDEPEPSLWGKLDLLDQVHDCKSENWSGRVEGGEIGLEPPYYGSGGGTSVWACPACAAIKLEIVACGYPDARFVEKT